MVAHTLCDFGDSRLPGRHDLKTILHHLLRCLLPLFGLFVCCHFLAEHTGVEPFLKGPNQESLELRNILLKSGDFFEVTWNFTYIPNKDEGPPMLDQLYGSDYILLHHQQVFFLSDFCAVMYIQYRSEADAKAAYLRTEVLWNCGNPVQMKVYGVFLVRVTASYLVLCDFAETAFREIDRNWRNSH